MSCSSRYPPNTSVIAHAAIAHALTSSLGEVSIGDGDGYDADSDADADGDGFFWCRTTGYCSLAHSSLISACKCIKAFGLCRFSVGRTGLG